jgi:hypothetical protein
MDENPYRSPQAPTGYKRRQRQWNIDWKMLAVVAWLMGGCIVGLVWALARQFYGL